MMNIQNLKDCEDAINSPIDFRTIKLTRFKEFGTEIEIIAFKVINTKFGRSYILLDNEGRRTLGNKKINDFVVKTIVHSDSFKDKKEGYKGLDDFHYNNGEIMFYITIGKVSEYNGHQYNEIKITLNNWSLSKDEFNTEQEKKITHNVLGLKDASNTMQWFSSNN